MSEDRQELKLDRLMQVAALAAPGADAAVIANEQRRLDRWMRKTGKKEPYVPGGGAAEWQQEFTDRARAIKSWILLEMS